MGDTIHISGVQGENVIVGKVTGSGNVIGKGNTISGTLTIHPEKVSAMPEDFQKSMQSFLEQVNLLLQQAKAKPEEIAPVQKAVETFAEEANETFEQVKENTPGSTAATTETIPSVPYSKKSSLKDKFVKMASGLMKLLPKTAATIASFTPLAPFGKLIGEGVGEIVKSISQEG